VEARTGEEAIWAICRDRPCAIVMECSVPGVSGLRAAEVLKGEPELEHIPILLLASAGDAEEERRAREAQCDLYMAEPDRLDSVLEALQWLSDPERTRGGCENHPRGIRGDVQRSASDLQWVDPRMRETWGGLRRA
jgi:two-component system cell cycle response regulator DivK